MAENMANRAKTLLENTKKLRFFKGQTYDGGADLYLQQLHSFLADFIAAGDEVERLRTKITMVANCADMMNVAPLDMKAILQPYRELHL